MTTAGVIQFRDVTLENLPEVANAIVAEAGQTKVWCFQGEMGAGKTTLIRHIALNLGITDTSSPTFALVNEYVSVRQEVIYHFDLFRLRSMQEALAIGVEEYFDKGNLCLIEWPEIIRPLLPEAHAWVSLEVVSPQKRNISISFNDREKEIRI